jgi:hypothetical protein|nr:hypothetical protein [Neorhizobium tomejilense]
MTEKPAFRDRVAQAAAAPFTRITSNVLLSSADSDYIRENGREGAEVVARRLNAMGGTEVKIEVEGIWDNDDQTLAWSGPRL